MRKSLGKSLKDRLTTLIGGFAVKEPYAAVVGGEASVGVAPVEAVGRALGYTEKELVLAADVLNRFAWRYPAEPSPKDANSTEAGRNRAA